MSSSAANASSGVKRYSWCSEPRCSAMRRAATTSGLSGWPTVKVRRGSPRSRMSGAMISPTMAESTPPLSKRPMPTSDISCARTARSNAARSAAGLPCSGAKSGASQAGRYHRCRPSLGVQKWPGGNSWTSLHTPTSDFSSLANHVAPLSGVRPMYNGLMPQWSRAASIRSPSPSCSTNANMPLRALQRPPAPRARHAGSSASQSEPVGTAAASAPAAAATTPSTSWKL
mmetsp:Transcript_48820/g.139699  ORF Transcript_48820/g.139699 Transcript_48820/m.139699 type:complete len:229 (+) Transcript_48820:1062-1748(+)